MVNIFECYFCSYDVLGQNATFKHLRVKTALSVAFHRVTFVPFICHLKLVCIVVYNHQTYWWIGNLFYVLLLYVREMRIYYCFLQELNSSVSYSVMCCHVLIGHFWVVGTTTMPWSQASCVYESTVQDAGKPHLGYLTLGYDY